MNHQESYPITVIYPLFPKEKLTPNYTPEEHSRYAEWGWEIGSHGWFQTDQAQIILPDSQVWKIINSLHNSTHLGRDNLKTLRKPILYHPQLAKVVRQGTQTCDTFRRNKPVPPPLTKPVQHQGPYPGEDWQVDFTAMPKTQAFSYLLIDTFTEWIEAFPTRTEKATEVCKAPLKEIVPRFVLPLSLQSDNGLSFTATISQNLATFLGIKYCLHLSWGPQALGKVERASQTLKSVLTKLCQEKHNISICYP